jgi:hypothetical protein
LKRPLTSKISFLLRSSLFLFGHAAGLLGGLLRDGLGSIRFLGSLLAALLGFGLGFLLGLVDLRSCLDLLRLLVFRRCLDGRRLRTLDQLHQRHRGVVARTRRHVQDARVATRTRLEARADGVEQLGDDLGVAQARERETAIGFAVVLAEGDQRLDHAAKLFGLRDGGADGLVTQQRHRQAAKQRVAVRAVTRQLTSGKVVTHFFVPNYLSIFRSFHDRHRA